MTNISITSSCNRSCSYCFAPKTIPPEKTMHPHMPIKTFIKSLDFLARSGIDQARLMGGEPTLHPDFPELIAHIISRGLKLLVFSNGFMPESSLSAILNTPEDQVVVLANVTEIYENDHSKQQLFSVLSKLGPRVMPGINIHSPQVRPDFLISLIESLNLSKTIRLGLAHPVLSGKNHFLHPKYYTHVGRTLVPFILTAAEKGIGIEFDCGFVPCMFPDHELNFLKNTFKDIGKRCNPVLDILPDGTFIPCYPLAGMFRQAPGKNDDAQSMRSLFESRIKPYRSLGIFKECSICNMKASGECTGGCLSAAMQRLRYKNFEFNVTETLPHKNFSFSSIEIATSATGEEKSQQSNPKLSDAKWAIPYIDQPLSFWQEIMTRFRPHIKEVYFPFSDNIIGSGRPAQPQAHLSTFLKHSPFPLSVLINPIALPLPVDELASPIITTLTKMRDEYNLVGATVANPMLAARIREVLPDIKLTASVLMDICTPIQIKMIEGIFDVLVPSSRIMRDLQALEKLEKAFNGPLRLIVNEACLPGCLLRIQHFQEMADPKNLHPHSLCRNILNNHPWLRLTGAWVLPQHLKFYQAVYGELKLAGRLTLQDQRDYLEVIDAYVNFKPLTPDRIGGGPASLNEPLTITDTFFLQTLKCRHLCYHCATCREYWKNNRFNIKNEGKA